MLRRYRIVIYNGDVDACVPYNGNEDWTAAMADKLGMTEIKGESWRPWQVGNVPAGCKCIGSLSGSLCASLNKVRGRRDDLGEPDRSGKLHVRDHQGRGAHGAAVPAAARPRAVPAVPGRRRFLTTTSMSSHS